MLSLCRRFACALALAPIAATCLAGGARAEGSLLVIMDGSGSIWGTIEGTRQTKLVVAKEALRRGLGKVAPQARVGLTLFGHRRGDCSDVEVVRPPEPRDVQRIMEPMDKLSPRGRGPITLAVREAAKVLANEPRPRSLLLIHDDADNCQPDLCAAAAELQTAGITAHVIGLGVKVEETAKMACLSQLTGGRHFNALNADQATSFIEEAILLSASGMGGVETTTTTSTNWAAKTDIVPPPPVPASGPPALHLRALLAPNTEPLTQPLFWTVAAEDRPDVFLYAARAVNPVVPVAPGKYVVEARDGSVSVKQSVEVRDNRPASLGVVLNAGSVRVRALARKNATVLPDAMLTVSDSNGALLLVASGGEATAVVPAGRIVVRAEMGAARSEQTITVAPGRLFAVDIPLNAAHLELSTPVARDGSFELDAPVFSVLEDDPDAPDGRRELARSAAQPATFVLAPGTYYVAVRQGAVEVRDRMAIGPGDVVRRVLAPAAGSLALATKPPPFGGNAEAHVSYRVTRIDGAQEPIVTSQPSPTLILPAGRYRLEARYGLMNVRSVREVDVRAGQAQQVTFEHEAAGLTLRMTGGGPADAAWVIQDQTGRIVWTGALPDALASLQAGRYVVGAETRNKRVERSVELKAGESRLLELPVE